MNFIALLNILCLQTLVFLKEIECHIQVRCPPSCAYLASPMSEIQQTNKKNVSYVLQDVILGTSVRACPFQRFYT